MVDGRWQAGKVTIDLNVGRSSHILVTVVSLLVSCLRLSVLRPSPLSISLHSSPTGKGS